MTNLHDVPLIEQDPEHWGNSILFRLAEARDYPRDAYNGFTVDPDELLDEVVRILQYYNMVD